MSRASDRLREFHEAFGVEREGDTADGRTPLSLEALARQRRTLHLEEHGELRAALARLVDVAAGPYAPGVSVLEHVAEELADEMVLLYGTADVLGIDLDVAFRLKMDANMAKLPDCEWCEGDGEWGDGDCPRCHGTGKGKPIKREDGKVLKPEGWQKPSMAEAIK